MLRRRERVEMGEKRAEKLLECRKRNLRLRLDSARPQDRDAGRPGDGPVEEGGLSDPGVAADDEDARALIDTRQSRIDPGDLG